MKLDSQPLIDAIPRPPCVKGDPAYRAWYLARKRGWVSFFEAVRICQRAGKTIKDVYPELSGEYNGHLEGELIRECIKCQSSFVAHVVGERGSPRKICKPCRTRTIESKACATCGGLFMPNNIMGKYCSPWCRHKAASSRQAQIRAHRNPRFVQRSCSMCGDYMTVKDKSKRRFCETCIVEYAREKSGYVSPYPMCGACGQMKSKSTTATCGADRCKLAHRRAKNAGRMYRILPETVLVLRSCPRCEACGTRFTDESQGVIDHCHTTWKIRGVLCSPCNVALGFAKEDPSRLRAIADYIEKHT